MSSASTVPETFSILAVTVGMALVGRLSGGPYGEEGDESSDEIHPGVYGLREDRNRADR